MQFTEYPFYTQLEYFWLTVLLGSKCDHIKLVNLFDFRAVIVGEHKKGLVVYLFSNAQREDRNSIISTPSCFDVGLANLQSNGDLVSNEYSCVVT